ncbi:phospholipase/carboxylesterase family protein-like protein [Pyrenochaeta sp. MPI-SDFR-AT-0127]|nr:phospholipase/carboxylesterase family protein-like protein [Pyrenochaeta sp. MPI-SDFR-AT-0127]
MILNANAHIVPSAARHTHTVVFLHGRGSDASTFCSEIFESQDSDRRFFTELFPGIKWVFPCAKKRYAETEDEDMHQWFDMLSVQRPQEDVDVQKAGLWESVAQVLEVLAQEAEIVGGMKNVIIAGINQGCATAMFTLLTAGIHAGGFFGLCGWLPLAEEIQELMQVPGRSKDVLKIPVLLQHCRDDDVVPLQNGEDLAERLRKMGMQVEWKCFDHGGHWLVEPKGMDGIVRFIGDIIKHSETAVR